MNDERAGCRAAATLRSGVFGTVLAVTIFVTALEQTCNADDFPVDVTAVRSAVQNAIPLLEAGSAGSAKHRQCFTCHSQALPVFALCAAKNHGFAVDEANLVRQIQHTLAHLERGRADYLQGKPQGGQVLTAGYALWTLQDGCHSPDETTSAVTHFLLDYQKEHGHWSHRGTRPPTSGSDFTATYVAIRALDHFAPDDQRQPAADRIRAVGEWVLSEKPKDTEDHVFRLKSMPYLQTSPETVDSAVETVLSLQQADGGWSQTPEMMSDAYATATVLETLLSEGGRTIDDDAVRKGIKFLLATQQDDGSWHVVTRAVPFQTYFETGFPHGKDQFISVSATAWATVALLKTLPSEVVPKSDSNAVSSKVRSPIE